MENTDYRLGDYKAVCDSCGFFFMASELQERWDGFRVCRKDWETRHPQEFVRSRPERTTPEWTSPDTDTVYPDLSTITGPTSITASTVNTLYRYSTAGAGGVVTVTLPDANDAGFSSLVVEYVIQLEAGTYGITLATTTPNRLIGSTSINVGQIARLRSSPSDNLWYRVA